MRRLFWCTLTAVALACKQSPRDARQELAQLNVPFTKEEFVGRCARGPTTLIDTFLAAGADPNVVVTDGLSYTPLMAAAEAGRADIAQQLFRAGARADFRAEDGRTALNLAAANCKKPEMVKLLLDKGARPDEQSLFTALWNVEAHPMDCSHATFAHLLDAGADPNRRNTKGQTPLMVAADAIDTESVHLLLQKNPDVNLQGGPWRWTALQFACKRALADRQPSMLAIVKELLKAGADPNLTDSFGQTALASLGPPSATPELNPIRNAITGTSR